jgi:hypothetical protein
VRAKQILRDARFCNRAIYDAAMKSTGHKLIPRAGNVRPENGTYGARAAVFQASTPMHVYSGRLGSPDPRAVEVNRPYLHRQDANVTMLLPLPLFSSTFRRRRPARLPFSICGLSFPRPHRSPDRGAKRHPPTRDMRSEQHRSCVGQV